MRQSKYRYMRGTDDTSDVLWACAVSRRRRRLETSRKYSRISTLPVSKLWENKDERRLGNGASEAAWSDVGRY